MNAIQVAQHYADRGEPVPADVAFDLLAQGIDPEDVGLWSDTSLPE
jgi:hypothetical protein